MNVPTFMASPRPCVLVTALALGLLPAAPSWAQQASDTSEEGPKVQSIRPVERGFFLESEMGITGFVATLGKDGDERKLGAATQIGIFAGYDVLPILSIGLGLRGLATGVKLDRSIPGPRGDILYLAPTLSVRFAVLTTERDFVWLRADAGFAFGLPGKIDGVDYAGHGPAGGVMAGYERFTKLRHFSIGASAGLFLVTKPSIAIGISVVPHVKYTF